MFLDMIALVLNAGCSIKGAAYAASAHGDMELNYYGNRNMLASFSPLIGHNGRVGNTHFFIRSPKVWHQKHFSRCILHDFPEDIFFHTKPRSKADIF